MHDLATEFAAVGTAVAAGLPLEGSQVPAVTALDAVEYALLRRSGYIPLGTIFHGARARARPGQDTHRAQRRRRP